LINKRPLASTTPFDDGETGGGLRRTQTMRAGRGAMKRSVFISNIVSISERPQGDQQSRVLEVEVETERGIRVLTLSMAAARQLHDGFAHVLKG
jgi:hypothetical protein